MRKIKIFNILRKMFWLINFLRLFPSIIFLLLSKNKDIISYEVDEYMKELKINKKTGIIGFIYLMIYYPEFRNVFYYRIGIYSKFIKFLVPPLSTLYIVTENIRAGLVICHGFSTIIAAESIGENCRIFQQVTIGGWGGSLLLEIM
ncbi:MAG: hypothetical protein LBQ22_06900 [Bacteroidales bacterium]|jgi:serine O-acetyltransferase|nr:hypothetical protein [Bacteroidales bacterium]